MNIIVAVSKNWAIGKDHKLLFNIPEDMRFFKEKTIGKVVLMGYNTFQSLPHKSPLKNRTNIVIAPEGVEIDNVTVVHSIEQLLTEAKRYPEDDVFVIGGGMLYRTMLPYCKTCYVTEVAASEDGDVYFEDLSNNNNWVREVLSPEMDHNGLKFIFTAYTNLSPLAF